jgi:hypothetical protein
MAADHTDEDRGTGRRFSIIQRRESNDAPTEVITLGLGVDHGDGTASVVSAQEGLPWPERTEAGDPAPVTVDIADLTAGHGHGGISTSLVYDSER